MADEGNANNNTEVFVYTEGAVVPQDVVHLRYKAKLEEVELCEGLLEIGEMAFYGCGSLKQIQIPSTTRRIGDLAFEACYKLEVVLFCEGLQEIGEEAFAHCSLKKGIQIPSTITKIGKNTFYETLLPSLYLHDDIESIGKYAFYKCIFTKFRLPPLITTLPTAFRNCKGMFSIELPDNISNIEAAAFEGCMSLRNISIPQDIQIDEPEPHLAFGHAFSNCSDLMQLFDSEEGIVHALEHRFDNLPIHRMLYYQSYNIITVEQLNNATNIRRTQQRSLRSKLDPSGSQQDCLGMTPLHILACSTIQSIDLYKVLVTKYPEALITEDRWGSTPLFYAVLGNAPDEIVQYLVDIYKSLYPDYVFDWTDMMATLGRANVSKENVLNLHNVHQAYFLEQRLNWNTILDLVCQLGPTRISSRTTRVLIQCSVSERVDAIGVRRWRKWIKKYIEVKLPSSKRLMREFVADVEAKLAHYETEYHKLKEATSFIELALWKHKMNDNIDVSYNGKRHNKRPKIDEADYRGQCHVSCGADIVIQHILPYLVSIPTPLTNIPTDDDFYSDDDSDSDF